VRMARAIKADIRIRLLSTRLGIMAIAIRTLRDICTSDGRTNRHEFEK
jgi:hypothetical protein